MMKSAIVALVIGVALGSVWAEINHNDHWLAYKNMHGKEYASHLEDSMRQEIFARNKAKVEKFNAEQSAAAGYTQALNHLADLTPSEYAAMNGLRVPASQENQENSPEAERFLQSILADNSEAVPEEVDWRKVDGRVSPVKNQGQCGSCWAFATVGVLEGQEIVRNSSLRGGLIQLSEQNLVDCSKKNAGCGGGWPLYALNFVYSEGGIDSETSYEYTAKDGVCKFEPKDIVFSDKGGAIARGGERMLKKLVANFGPVAVAIEANHKLQHYESGIFDDEACGTDVNHAVLVVGYGTDPDHGDFWIVKNSWSENWGEQGYFRMARNKNLCGIQQYPTIATF